MNTFLLFNHRLTPDQVADAAQCLQTDEMHQHYLPDPLQKLWSNVPPELESLDAYLAPITAWLDSVATAQDYVLVQGDFGATYWLVQHCKAQGYVPIYGTTARQTREVVEADGSIRKESIFKHVRFRRYS